MKKELRNTMLILAALYMIMGLVMMIWPESACRIACYVLGAGLFTFGVYQTISYFSQKNAEIIGGSLFIGVITMLIGILVVLRADVVVTVLVALLGIFVVADSIIKFVFTREMRKAEVPGWKVQMISVLVLFLLGLFMLFDPFGSAKAMVICAGAFLLFDGIGNIVTVITVNKFLH